MAAAALRRRGLQWSHCGLRFGQNGGRVQRVSRPHHLPRCSSYTPQARTRHQAHECCASCNGTGFSSIHIFVLLFVLLRTVKLAFLAIGAFELQ